MVMMRALHRERESILGCFLDGNKSDIGGHCHNVKEFGLVDVENKYKTKSCCVSYILGL